ncbi:MAG: hypothetical protein ABIG30_00935 [Candidatus Aenigmatarchaeota archaeon]
MYKPMPVVILILLASLAFTNADNSVGNTTILTTIPYPINIVQIFSSDISMHNESVYEIISYLESEQKLMYYISNVSSATAEQIAMETEKTRKNIIASRELRIDESNLYSTLTLNIQYVGDESLSNLVIYDKIPKIFSILSGQMTIDAPGADITIINSDPVFAIRFSGVHPNQNFVIKYITNRTTTNEALKQSKFSVFAIPLPPSTSENADNTMLIAIIAIIVIAVVGILLNRKTAGKFGFAYKYHPSSGRAYGVGLATRRFWNIFKRRRMHARFKYVN